MHYHLHASITAVRFFSIGRAITEHREGGFSFAPTLFSGSLCRSLPTCMTYVCMPVQAVQGVLVGVQIVQEVQAVQAKVQADFSITHTAQLYEYQHITIKECKMQAICAKNIAVHWNHSDIIACSRITPIARIFLLVQRALAPRR